MIRGVLCAGLLMVAAGCERKTEERIVKTDANELAKVMQLPVAPRAVKWVRATPGKGGPIGPNDATIVALLEFSDEGMKAMREKLDAAPDAEPVALTPQEVSEIFGGVDTSTWQRPAGKLVVVPGDLHGVGAFAKAPFLAGKSVVVTDGVNQVLVVLFTT